MSTGQVPFMFDQLTAAKSLADAGKLKIIAVTTPSALPLQPNLPTMMESGVPNFQMSSWQAVYAPKGTPKAVVQRLNAEIVKILRLPDVKEKLGTSLGMEIVGSTPEELAAHMAKDSALGGTGREIGRDGKLGCRRPGAAHSISHLLLTRSGFLPSRE